MITDRWTCSKELLRRVDHPDRVGGAVIWRYQGDSLRDRFQQAQLGDSLLAVPEYKSRFDMV